MTFVGGPQTARGPGEAGRGLFHVECEGSGASWKPPSSQREMESSLRAGLSEESEPSSVRDLQKKLRVLDFPAKLNM